MEERFASGVTPGYDAAGNMICDGIYNYTYDAWNRLLTVQRPGGTTPQTIATYRYDGLGRRIYKNVQNTGRSTPVLPRDNRGFDGEEYYYYDYQWRLLEVRVPTYDPATGNVTGDRTRQQFVWGSQYIDEAICMDVNTQTAGTGYGTCADAGSRRFFYCQDANYNVVALRESTHSGSPPNETITNTIVERYEYDPYGTVRVVRGWDAAGGHEAGCVVGQSLKWLDANLPSNPVLYCGYLHDWETTSDNVRNRVYTSRLGRWMQRDPANDLTSATSAGPSVDPLILRSAARRSGASIASFLGLGAHVDGMNSYQYMRSAPANGTDPLGLFSGFGYWPPPASRACQGVCGADVTDQSVGSHT